MATKKRRFKTFSFSMPDPACDRATLNFRLSVTNEATDVLLYNGSDEYVTGWYALRNFLSPDSTAKQAEAAFEVIKRVYTEGVYAGRDQNRKAVRSVLGIPDPPKE